MNPARVNNAAAGIAKNGSPWYNTDIAPEIRSAHSGADRAAIDAVNEKYDERLRLYDAGIRQWDTNVSVVMILRGEKR